MMWEEVSVLSTRFDSRSPRPSPSVLDFAGSRLPPVRWLFLGLLCARVVRLDWGAFRARSANFRPRDPRMYRLGSSRDLLPSRVVSLCSRPGRFG